MFSRHTWRGGSGIPYSVVFIGKVELLLFHPFRNGTRIDVLVGLGMRAGDVALFVGFAQLAVDRGWRESGDVGHLSDGLLLGLQVDEFLQVFGFGEFVLGTEVVGFFDVVLEHELGVALDLLQAVEDDVVGVVLEGAGADFDLFDVTEEVVLGGTADGDAGIEEVHQFGAAGQVVLGHRCSGLPLGRVADDDEGEAVLALEGEDLLHEGTGGFAFLGVVQEEGDVVHEDVADAFLLGCFGHAVQDGLLQAGVHNVVGAEFGPEEVVGEAVDDVGVFLDVAHLELFGGEFAVDVEDFLFAGDGLGQLGAEDGLAAVGGGDDYCAFVFYDEAVEVHLGIGGSEAVIHPVVGGFDGHDAYLVRGPAGLFGLCFYGAEGIFHVTSSRSFRQTVAGRSRGR